MHLKRSFVTRELALHACTLSALPDGLYIIRAWKVAGEKAGFTKERSKKEKKERKEILSLTNMHVNKGDDT